MTLWRRWNTKTTFTCLRYIYYAILYMVVSSSCVFSYIYYGVNFVSTVSEMVCGVFKVVCFVKKIKKKLSMLFCPYQVHICISVGRSCYCELSCGFNKVINVKHVIFCMWFKYMSAVHTNIWLLWLTCISLPRKWFYREILTRLTGVDGHVDGVSFCWRPFTCYSVSPPHHPTRGHNSQTSSTQTNSFSP